MKKNNRDAARTFDDVSFYWLGFVVSLQIYISLEFDSLIDYSILAFAHFIGISLLLSIKKMFIIMDTIDSCQNKTQKFQISPFVLERSRRSFFNYIKAYPYEHPYLSMSIIGQIKLVHLSNYLEDFTKSVLQVPITNMIYIPSILLVIF